MIDKSQERETVVARLIEDLIGPHYDDEELESRPSDVYLTGILWPAIVKMSEDDNDGLGTANYGEEANYTNEAVKTRSLNKPSLAGLSFSVYSKQNRSIRVTCKFATYELARTHDCGSIDGSQHVDKSSGSKAEVKSKRKWVRHPHEVAFDIQLRANRNDIIRLSDHGYDKTNVEISLRSVEVNDTILVTLTLINGAQPIQQRDDVEASTLFQTSLRVDPCKGTFLVPKQYRSVSLSPIVGQSNESTLSDEDSGRLLYRKASEYAVGQVCSAVSELGAASINGRPTAKYVQSTWIPSTIVEGMDPNGHHCFAEIIDDFQNFNLFSANDLAWTDAQTLVEGLNSFCGAYEKWIVEQEGRLGDHDDVSPQLTEIAQKHLCQCRNTLKRMRSSVVNLQTDEKLRRSFQLANLAMSLQFSWDKSKSQSGQLNWRPFQLGFLLLSLPSAVTRTHHHRNYMDLLWFPTGGGKTEAYLALIACVAVYRRLSDDRDDHSGVCALMRYTLRLLTTQQFSRSSAMILALEAMRLGRVEIPAGLPLKGNEPFGIGLWVGNASTPNTRKEAFESLRQSSSEVSSPKQLLDCPCCGNKINWTISGAAAPVRAECQNSLCQVSGTLPVYTVDEDVYEFRPTLLIGTIDKFAQIVRRKETNHLFGILEGSPPDLIIQDELHLISGPLGTIAGAYEAAFDLMFENNGFCAKVIGSTATIRKAPEQVLALFNRKAYQFPPPAIDHDNFGFAVPDQRNGALGRRYIGITTAGRSATFSLQAVSGSLLQSADGAFDENETKDSYWTLVSYFNSLRELGGALVLMQDVVKGSIKLYAEKRGEAVRNTRNVEELTSRRTQEEITRMLEILGYKTGQDGAVDVVLATNMVSVGIDIARLGLMLVNSQPKTTAEYIQATSRVGRASVGGLVVSLLNNAKARDRSHFENFNNWHQTLYRDIEATSVTPFASRARDKVLHAALVTSVRHTIREMLDSPADIENYRQEVTQIIESIGARADIIDPEENDVRDELLNCLEQWIRWMPESYWNDRRPESSLLQNAENIVSKQRRMYLNNRPWRTLNAMRTVEPATPFKMISYLRDKDNERE